MLFSDWDRSGRRDLRVSNDRHYYDHARGGSSSGGSRPARRPASTRTRTAGRRCRSRAWGSPATTSTGDGYPEVYLTSQARTRLQTLTAGPGQPTYGDIAPQAAVRRPHRPFTGGDTAAVDRWHPEFEDVNNDGFVDLFVIEGQRRRRWPTRPSGPEQPVPGPPDGTFGEVAEEAGILTFDRGRGAALADFNLDGLLDLVEVNRGAGWLWRNVGVGVTRRRPHRWATGWRCG